LGLVESIRFLNLSRSDAADKFSPFVFQFFDFSTLNTMINLSDLKGRMKVLIAKVFGRM
jgi:hypothetical protein